MGYRLLILILLLGWLPTCYGENVMDLQGGTYRVTESDLTFFDGREVRNGTLVVTKGNYLISVKKEGGTCLKIGDNTELIIDGTIKLTPNDFKSYDMIRVVGNHVKIHGKGSLVGDKFTHTGKEGEWGMGIHFRGASNATLSGLTIKDCWGDCIYVGRQSKNIRIKNCRLDNGRRQGISITSADSVFIKDCTISNVSGTNPQYGIDIEPNKNCSVHYVLIENVNVVNCEGGIRATVPNAGVGNASIGTVVIRNCQVSAQSRYPIHLNRCVTGTVKGCTIDATNDRPSLYANYVNNLKVSNNTLNVDVKLFSSIKNKLKDWVGKGSYSVIRVVHGSDKGVRDNKINKR